ncbi:MAG: hypothetical protein QGD92_08255 [Gammaproteobacteria bacterium]|nr:hypothetical protein [Gammaproteobacteria bacterium]
MRFLPLIAVAMFAICGHGVGEDLKIIDESQMVERDGLCYEYDATTPFTGRVSGKFYSGQPRIEIHYKNGKKDGSSTSWYETGKVRMQSSYKDGKRDGRWVKWNANGQIQFQKMYKNGMRVN